MSWAFWFDASACSGCKACQVACKDKHGLPLGVRWRRVYEVTGGGWERRGDAWLSSVFAYNVSMACNHCERPICMEVCPTRAITRRDDGLVLIDADRCMGCRYCEWACPYGAPQYDAAAGVMTKCTFCADELDAGNPPACVAACPLRVLDFGTVEALEAKYGPGAVPAPLPDPSLTDPGLVVTAHPASASSGRGSGGGAPASSEEADTAAPARDGAPRVANREEVA
ncbi:MAG: DMSO/selenate family reductase complex B subunit [Longimicrobiales bacterium]